MELKVNYLYEAAYDALSNEVTFFEFGKLDDSTKALPHVSVYEFVKGGGEGTIVVKMPEIAETNFSPKAGLSNEAAVILFHEMISWYRVAKE
jgi:hypothetical protein